MSMYFLDETDDWSEYEMVRLEIRRFEMHRMALLEALRELEATVASSGASGDFQEKREALELELRETEKILNESLSMYR